MKKKTNVIRVTLVIIISLFVAILPILSGTGYALSPNNTPVKGMRILTYAQFVNLIAKIENISITQAEAKVKNYKLSNIHRKSIDGTGEYEYITVYERENFGTWQNPVTVELGVPAILYVNGGTRYFAKVYTNDVYTAIISSGSETWTQMYAIASQPNAVTVILDGRGVATVAISNTTGASASVSALESVGFSVSMSTTYTVYLRKVCQFDPYTYTLYPGL